MTQPYARPPITEAVVELRFEEKLSKATLEKAQKRLTRFFPTSEEQNLFQVQVEVGKGATGKPKTEFFGYRLASDDQADILVLRPQSFGRSRLPPYIGWPAFKSRVESEWSEFRRIAGSLKISRIGVRYINRIDIPRLSYPEPKAEQFIKIYPNVPPELPKTILSFVMQTVLPLEEEKCTAIININSAPSPLLDHVSVVLDIDVARDSDVPRIDEQIWKLAEDIRAAKNRIFEACITDESRRLFT